MHRIYFLFFLTEETTLSILFIDTDGELWHDKAEEIGAQLIRMPYTLNGEEFFDDGGKTSDYLDFFTKLRNGGSSTTSALNTNDYINYFEPWFAKGEDILYISFGSNFSATFNFLQQAVDELSSKYPDTGFYRFDTGSISMGSGFMMYYGGKKFNETNGNIEETVKYLEDLKKHVFTAFIVDDLNHLKRGGRLSSAVAFAGTLLGIKPVLKITDAEKIENVDKVKGSKKVNDSKKVVSYLADEFKLHCIDTVNYDVWIMQADCPDAAEALKNEILAAAPQVKIHVQYVGPVIGTHCGPGTLGLIFYSDKR